MRPDKLEHMKRAVTATMLAAALPALAAASARASFAGENGLIAYSTAPEAGADSARIYTMTPDGERRRPLTRRGSARNPAWSRDGKRIAFDRTSDSGRQRLYVMEADGARARRVPTGRLHAYNPSWSKNGRKLVFQGCPGAEACEQSAIYVVRLDGSRPKRIAPNGSDPVWSPTGRWIAHHGRLADGDECSTLLRVKPSGRARQAVLPRNRDSHDVCSWGGSGADFSPDGSRLVYHGLHATGYKDYPHPVGGTFRVWTYDPAMFTVGLDGSGRKVVATRTLAEFEWFLPPFVWSPDGRKLLWRDERGVFVGYPDGSGARRISDSGGELAWQALPAG
jgi:Tol biopolymer transport system component